MVILNFFISFHLLYLNQNGGMLESLSDMAEHGGDDAAAATADGIEDGVASGAAGGGISVLGMNMNMNAEMSADAGAGAAEEMGFDVLEIGEGVWMDFGVGGGGGGDGEGAGVWGALESELEDALEGVGDEVLVLYLVGVELLYSIV